MKALKLLAALLFLTSCLPNSKFAEGPQKACTLIGALNHIEVDLGDGHSQTNYLAAAVDGDALVADECDPALNNDFQIVRELRQAHLIKYSPYDKVIGDIITGDIDFERRMKIKLYGRASCDQPLQLLAENDAVVLQWEPVYPNGAHCESDGHNGYGTL